MRISLAVKIGALFVCLLAGCANGGAALSSASRTHLDDQSAHLQAASDHLTEAHKRLAAEPDPHNAAAEVDAGNSEVQQAQQSNLLIRQDLGNLSNSAANLQKEIDSHKNDLLGPRAIRIRNRVILAIVLLSVGAALLQLGPLMGGPFGGAMIVIGHLLTIFISPLLKLAWAGLVWLWGWIETELEKLGNKAVASAKPTTLNSQGASNASAGSD